MGRPANRSQLMDRLGAVQLNTVWSWCGVNDSERKVYFSIWTDNTYAHNGAKSYIIQEPDWGVNEQGHRSAARNDQDDKFSLVFEQGYEPWGYFIEAKDRRAHPREIASTLTSFVMQLQLDKLQDGTIIGTPLKRIEVR
ncbi:MAG TPA: hypothetical protein VJ798_08000 [Rhizomicrobium sp.]|nr:hypothetical protein [Rhizomicrobium sp.]